MSNSWDDWRIGDRVVSVRGNRIWTICAIGSDCMLVTHVRKDGLTQTMGTDFAGWRLLPPVRARPGDTVVSDLDDDG